MTIQMMRPASSNPINSVRQQPFSQRPTRLKNTPQEATSTLKKQALSSKHALSPNRDSLTLSAKASKPSRRLSTQTVASQEFNQGLERVDSPETLEGLLKAYPKGSFARTIALISFISCYDALHSHHIPSSIDREREQLNRMMIATLLREEGYTENKTLQADYNNPDRLAAYVAGRFLAGVNSRSGTSRELKAVHADWNTNLRTPFVLDKYKKTQGHYPSPRNLIALHAMLEEACERSGGVVIDNAGPVSGILGHLFDLGERGHQAFEILADTPGSWGMPIINAARQCGYYTGCEGERYANQFTNKLIQGDPSVMKFFEP